MTDKEIEAECTDNRHRTQEKFYEPIFYIGSISRTRKELFSSRTELEGKSFSSMSLFLWFQESVNMTCFLLSFKWLYQFLTAQTFSFVPTFLSVCLVWFPATLIMKKDGRVISFFIFVGLHPSSLSKYSRNPNIRGRKTPSLSFSLFSLFVLLVLPADRYRDDDQSTDHENTVPVFFFLPFSFPWGWWFQLSWPEPLMRDQEEKHDHREKTLNKFHALGRKNMPLVSMDG